MSVAFETEFGTVEVMGGFGWGGEAYFKRDDICCDINADGEFTHVDGAKFRVLWPLPHDKVQGATLQIMRWNTLGHATVKR